MLLKSSAKVGAVVLLALVLGFVLYGQLAHLKTNSYTVKLNVPDTQGLSAQSVVRMEGVAVGEVTSVDLDPNNKPLIYLAIKKKYRIPSNYIFKITSGILITQAQVQIMPPATSNAKPPLNPGPVTYFPTDNTAEFTSRDHAPSSLLETVDPELHETFTKLNQTFTLISERFSDASDKIAVVLTQTQHLMDTANKIAGSTNNVISDPSLKKNLLATLDNVRMTTETAHKLTISLSKDLDEFKGSSKSTLTDLGGKVNALLGNLDATVDGANAIIKKVTDQVSDPHLQQSLQRTLDLVQATVARFNQIASDIHTLTGDPALQGNLKRTVANLSDASDKMKDGMEKVDQILGKVSDTSHRVPKLPKIIPIANISEQISPARFRVDLDAWALLGKNSLLDIGIFDLGEDTRFNLQAGNYLSKSFDVRYGVHASKIGAGLDYWAQKGTGIQADLYDTNTPRLDVKALYRVNNIASFWIGGDNLLRTPIPLVGIQLTH